MGGKVGHLFIKPAAGEPMQPVETMRLIANRGIQGDIQANPSSPRQLLIVRQEDLDAFALTPGTLRENLVISGLSSIAIAPGARLDFNNGGAIRLTFYCEPCQQIKSWVPSLKQIEHKRGILGVALTSGQIAPDTLVESTPKAFAPIPEQPYRRFLQLVARIPTGKVVTYQQIITSIGVTRSYYRVLPLYLKKASKETTFQYPIHRVVDSKGYLLSHIPGQSAQLAAEGLPLDATQKSCLNLEISIWKNPKIYGN